MDSEYSDDNDNEDVFHTDDEDEVAHDHVVCSKCDTKTHISNGCCSNCGEIFLISKSGYLIEKDGFIANESDNESMPCNDSDEDIEYEFTDEESDEDSDDEEMFLDEGDYEPKLEVFVSTPRIMTRSRTKYINSRHN